MFTNLTQYALHPLLNNINKYIGCINQSVYTWIIVLKVLLKQVLVATSNLLFPRCLPNIAVISSVVYQSN